MHALSQQTMFEPAPASLPMQMRPYQEGSIQQVRQLIREGNRSILVVAPTGAGKTVIFSYIVAEVARRGQPVLILAHRRELINQTVKKVIAAGVPRHLIGVIMGDDPRRNPHALVQIASIDTLRNKPTLPPAKVVIIDEAHRALSPSYVQLSERYPDAIKLGFSVGPDSIVEFRGGCFGAGWVGSISDAFTALATTEPVLDLDGYDVIRAGGIESRGWIKNGFGWKPVKSFIRHTCDKPTRSIRTAGDDLVLTDDHSIYRVEHDGYALKGGVKRSVAAIRERHASVVEVGDVLPADDGANWDGAVERVVDVASIVRGMEGAHVAVDLSKATRAQIGASPSLWYSYRHGGSHGNHLPVDLYLRHAKDLPEPTHVYTEGAIGCWTAPKLRLSQWAYVLGFWLGDGWIDGNRLGFAVETARVDHMMAQLQSLPGVSWKPSARQTPGKSVDIRCSNAVVAAVLRSVVGDAKAHSKKIPGEWITSWPRAARIELLHGLIDSDGYVNNADRGRRRVHYVTVSPDLGRSILSLLRSVGVQGTMRRRAPGAGGIVNGRQITATRESYVIHWSLSAMEGNNDGHSGARQRFVHRKLRFNEAPVRAVVPVERPMHVYDLEMEGHPSFVANGVLVHNTATPWRLDGKGLGRMYGELVVVASVQQLIDEGFLVRPRVFTHPVRPDLSKVAVTSGGDYDEEQLAAAVDKAALIGNIVEHYRQHASGLRAFAFAASVEHSIHIADAFNAAGIAAEHVDGTTDSAVRDAALERFRSGQTMILANCGVYTEGTDVPEAKCAILARPTKSRILYFQCGGRVLRPALGMDTAIILDHGGCAVEFGRLQDPQEYSLGDVSKRRGSVKSEAAVRLCPNCYFAMPTRTRECEECSYTFPIEPRQVEQRDGQLVEMKPSEDPAARELRATIQTLTISIDRTRDWRVGETNRRLWDRYRKSRTEMTTIELRGVLHYLSSDGFTRDNPPPAPVASTPEWLKRAEVPTEPTSSPADEKQRAMQEAVDRAYPDVESRERLFNKTAASIDDVFPPQSPDSEEIVEWPL
jgi:superfamily II DNA or RNA helicase